MFPKPISWLEWKKQNLTQQKHTFTNQKKCTTQNKHKKTKVRFSRLLRHLAWKQRGPILVSVLHKSVTYLLTQTITHLLTVPDNLLASTEKTKIKNTKIYNKPRLTEHK